MAKHTMKMNTVANDLVVRRSDEITVVLINNNLLYTKKKEAIGLYCFCVGVDGVDCVDDA